MKLRTQGARWELWGKQVAKSLPHGVATAVSGIVFFALATLMICGVVLTPVSAQAQSLQITTPYPVIGVQPGGTSSLDLNLESSEVERVDLKVVAAPEGWLTVIRGGGSEISAVYVNPQDEPRLGLEVEVPATATGGDYEVVVEASTGQTSVRLPITLVVSEEARGGTTLETEFPTLKGPADAGFRFRIDLRNESPEEQTYNISATGPQGWKVSLLPSGAEKETPTVTVQPDSTQSLSLEVEPPMDVETGEYEFQVQAAGAGDKETLDVVVGITGTYDLSITSPQERLNATIKAGGTTEVPLVVKNNGTGEVRGVELSATPPTDWKVEFQPAVIDAVSGGEEVPVTAVFTPAEGALAGDYMVTLKARGDQDGASADFRVTVETSTMWGLVGVIIIVVALAALVLVFRRYGRR